jgi:glycosyltransferase involved in cell wall biosynthesis
MKILVAHNLYQQPGGEDHCVTAEVAMLEAHGHEVISYRLHNDSIHALGPLRAASRTIWSRPAYRQVRELLRTHRPQIAHFHNTFPLISPAAYYAARAENVGVVQTLHNFRLLCPNAMFFREGRACEDCLGRSFAWPGIVHKCYRGSRTASAAVATMATAHRVLGTWRKAVDVYIALTEFSRRKFIQGRLPAEKIVVKSNFVYPDPGAGAGTGGYAMFVGRLSAEKGVETLLAAWKAVRNRMPLKIVGDGPLAAMVADSVASDSRIEWLGHKPVEEVYALLGDAAFLVFPSQCYETFGRVAIEAFAKGTPVVASQIGAIAELVEHGRTGLLFKPGDSAALAQTIMDLASHPEQLIAMRGEARAEFESRYTATCNYQQLMAIYGDALRARGNYAAAESSAAEWLPPQPDPDPALASSILRDADEP